MINSGYSSYSAPAQASALTMATIYCSASAASAYSRIETSQVLRDFVLRDFVLRDLVLGPPHHYSLGGCAVLSCAWYETPIT